MTEWMNYMSQGGFQRKGCDVDIDKEPNLSPPPSNLSKLMIIINK